MRRLRLLSMASMLALVLAPGALAGIIECPPAPAPPPASAMGTIDTPPSATEGPTDPVLDIALDLLLGALVLF